MSFKPKPVNTQPPIPAAVHHAICYSIVDMGTQRTVFEGQESWKPQIQLTFELPAIRSKFKDDSGAEVDKPRVTGNKYTLSFHKKSNLAILYRAWTGQVLTNEAQVKGLLGMNCLLTMAHTAKEGVTYSNIAGVSGLMAGMETKKPENAMVMYEIEQGEPPESIPQWLREKIKQSVEFTGPKNAQGSQKLAAAQEAYGMGGQPYDGSEPTPENPAPSDNDIPW